MDFIDISIAVKKAIKNSNIGIKNVKYKDNSLIFTLGNNSDIVVNLPKNNNELTEKQKITLSKLIITGNGDKFLADDGNYKELQSMSGGSSIDDQTISAKTTYSSEKIFKEINKVVPIFKDFEENKYYKFKEIILHDNLLLFANKGFTSTDKFDKKDWTLFAGDMTRSVYDKNNDGIIDKSEYAKVAEIALETSLLQTWKPDTVYISNQQLVHLNKIYTVTSDHRSPNIFSEENLELTATGYHDILWNKKGGKNDEFYHIDKNHFDIIMNINKNGDNLFYDKKLIGNMDSNIYDKNKNGIVDEAETLTGLIVKSKEINQLKGIETNIQKQLDAIQKGMTFIGVSESYEKLNENFPSAVTGEAVVIETDETHSNDRTYYIKSNNEWIYLGVFEYKIRDFSTEPLDLTKETIGTINIKQTDGSIAAKEDIHKHDNFELLQTYTNSNNNICETIKNNHIHKNKDILDSYSNTNGDITEAIKKTHTHENIQILNFFSEDNDKNLLYKGSPLKGIGSGSGIGDLSSFTTNDLRDAINKRYITDAEKKSIAVLPGIIDQQYKIDTKLDAIANSLPEDISKANQVITKTVLDNSIKNLKLINLQDVDNRNLKINHIPIVSENNIISFINPNEKLFKIKNIIDKNNSNFSDVDKIKFNNCLGNINKDGVLELENMISYSTDLKDMPKKFIHDSVLIANAYDMKYELRTIEDLTNSKANFNKEIKIENWRENSEDNNFECIITHNLNSKNLITSLYDFDNNYISLNFKIIDENNIILKSDKKPTEIYTIIINCSQGVSNGGFGGNNGLVTTKDFLDDDRTRLDKTYSSNKIMNILNNYVLSNNVYSTAQSDAKFALKDNDHTHFNKVVLDNINIDKLTDSLYYKDKKILMDFNPFSYTKKWSIERSDSLSMLIDIKDICKKQNINVILASEFIIRNEKPYKLIKDENENLIIPDEDKLRLVVTDNNIVVLDELINPDSTQKYELGISPNVKINVEGVYTANLCINAY